MKLEEGTFSHVPAQPHTGLLGILIKHREQLEPGNRITGNAAVQTMALSRAIIEALGGKQIEGRWEVEIDGPNSPFGLKGMVLAVETGLDSLAMRISKLDEAQENLEDKYDEKVKALESRVAELEQDFRPGGRIDKISALVNANLTISGERGPLVDRVDRLEQMFAGANKLDIPAPRKRSTAKPSEEV